MRYRVKVESYVVVEGHNIADAKARAELALRNAVGYVYRSDMDIGLADGWELYAWQAKKAERLPDDEA